MKRQIFLILFLIGFLAYTGNINAQLLFTSADKQDMNILADSIISNAKRKYIYKSEKQENKYSYYLEFANVEDDFDRLYIYIKVFWRGENEDLEVQGTPEYNFSFVQAPFLDLFPFWNKFIRQDSAEDITKVYATSFFKENKVFVISKSHDKWSISMRDKIE